MKNVHLISNAHLDPYWLWEWEEGAATVLSTFRTAADLCEKFDDFIFNHNEVILYKWVEEYEPALFTRIQRLVREGKWHIMGGWYLQPDCNMPSGESFTRQILLGNNYFQEKLGVKPTTTINFDPFGHTRGLVQILKKSGYDSYLHCRPAQEDCPLPDIADYTWVGYDGSEINGHRAIGFYNSPLGKARDKIENWLKQNSDRPVGLILWGVGDHGGGPSHQDLAAIAELMKTTKEPQLLHSTPEAYFAELRELGAEGPRHEKDVNPWGSGCYTSQIRLKQKHRLLENEIYAIEKMASAAALNGLMAYPYDDIHQALCDLMVAEFHDILPGSSIQPVEDAGIRLMDHGLEILSRIKARAFFAMASGQHQAPEGQIPIMAYNPHPYPVTGIFECEFNTHDACFEEQFSIPVVHHNGVVIASQNEQEASNLNLDWRKRCVFQAELAPGQITRFDCTLEILPKRPQPEVSAENGRFTFKNDRIEAVINAETGLMDKYAVDGVDYITPGAFRGLVINDTEDPWGMNQKEYRDVAGVFTLMDREAGTRFSGVKAGLLDSVRVIEDGPVRTVIEALFSWGDSFLVLTYRLPKQGTELEVHVRVHWNEKDKMLKLGIPTPFAGGTYHGQVAYGRDELPGAEREVVAQKWVAAVSKDDQHALTCINDSIYGSDFVDGEVRLSLLRSAAYSGHPIGDRPIVPQDRYTPRIDQGERQYLFWFQGGPKAERFDAIERESLAHNEQPMVISFFPSGAGEMPAPGAKLDDNVVQMPVFKRSEDGEGYIVRLFEPTGVARSTTLSIPALGIQQEVSLTPFELKTFWVDPESKRLTEADLLERPMG